MHERSPQQLITLCIIGIDSVHYARCQSNAAPPVGRRCLAVALVVGRKVARSANLQQRLVASVGGSQCT
jgi:hypothetical protein